MMDPMYLLDGLVRAVLILVIVGIIIGAIALLQRGGDDRDR